jgi:hypothetical protein
MKYSSQGKNMQSMEEIVNVVPKFKLGDRVATKFTGLPTCGNIVVIYNPKAYCVLYGVENHEDYGWTRHHENWYNEAVYLLILDEPQKPNSLNEIAEAVRKHKPNATDEYVLGIYDTIKSTRLISYGEFDLELVE